MHTAIVFLPLLGAALAGLAPRLLGDRMCQLVPTGFLVVSAVLSWIGFVDALQGGEQRIELADWVLSGEFAVSWALRIDALTAVMLVVVTTISAVVHAYSIGYMHHDPHRPRFFSYLSLFTFAMLMLVTSDNFLQLFFGWEGVGLASYLLIGFWYKRPSANAAAIKAFIVNRVGDFGFALGVMAIFVVVGSVDFDTVFAAVPELVDQTITIAGYAFNAVELVALLLFIGAMGKSAQFLLHTWLPDAMEGPTPVSALIHAATMVTAGVFLVARCSPILEYAPVTLSFIAVIGAITAFFAATVGLVQNDIKRVIAYSTCSQLGYMFFAAGVGAYEAAIFHLFTHAFFKALLFLGAGSVIHAMGSEQDMRRMGGLRTRIPQTYWLMVIGTLSLTGVGIPGLIGFAGFHSKDIIIEAAFAGGSGVAEFAFVAGVTAAAMTSFYSWRLIFLTFHGEPRHDAATAAGVHESPRVMLVPLYVLAAGSVIAGAAAAGLMVGEHPEAFWGASIFIGEGNHVLKEAHHAPFWVKASPFVAMLVGLGLAFLFYLRNPAIPVALAARHRPLYLFLLNKWYFDEIYDLFLVTPAKWIGWQLWRRGDGGTIDGVLHLVALRAIPSLTRAAQRLQSGYLYHYAFAMILGISFLITWFAGIGTG